MRRNTAKDHGIYMGVDPGTTQSAFVLYTPGTHTIIEAGIVPNDVMLDRISKQTVDGVVIEMVASYGMAVSKTVFDTVLWIGRYVEVCDTRNLDWRLAYRKKIVTHLCGKSTAGDSAVRSALIDMFPATGGGAIPAIGTKKQPGPCYGITADMWSALAIVLYGINTPGTWNEIPQTV